MVNARNWFLTLVLVVLVHRETRAEYDPPFDMDSCVGEAKLIVSGYLDPTDTITVTEIFAGDPGGTRIDLGEWGGLFRRLAQPHRWWEKPPAWKRVWRWIIGPHRIEVVAFLRPSFGGGWTPGGASWDLVPLSGDAVYPFNGFEYHYPQPLYSRTEFFAALREAIQTKAERTRLLANFRTYERNRKLLSLALRHNHLPGAPDGFWFTPYYHLTEIAKGFAQPSAEEEELILGGLREAQTDAQKANALRLIALVPLTGKAFEAVVPYIDARQPAEIRRSAIRAIGAVDGFRAVDAFGPLLTRSEPELQTVLESLRLDQKASWNRAIVDDLLRLTAEFPTYVSAQEEAVRDYRVSNQLSHIGGLLSSFMHPRFLPMLVDCSVSIKQFSPPAARNLLTDITHLKLPSEDGREWQRWWESVRRLLEVDYDLQTEAGRGAWIASWSAGDAAARRVLVNLWLFEPETEAAKALFREAPTSEATMAVLSELWARKRLTPELEKAIVEQYLRFEVAENDPPPLQKATDGRLAILVKSAFTFPPNVSVGFRSGQVIGGVKDLRSWDDSGTDMLATLPGRRWPLDRFERLRVPMAGLTLEMRYMDYWPQRKVRWTVSWNLDPIQLRNVAR